MLCLSAFDLGSEVGSDLDGAMEGWEEEQQARARVVDGAVEWSFLGGIPSWSPPTASLIKAHEDKFPRWREVKPGAAHL